MTAAIPAVAETTSLSELLRRCVAFGGDVDTVATIAPRRCGLVPFARTGPPRSRDRLPRGWALRAELLGRLDADLREHLGIDQTSERMDGLARRIDVTDGLGALASTRRLNGWMESRVSGSIGSYAIATSTEA
ncbi:MAG: hypothetical protein N2037_06045 [Acidimicrobiales bacterium]|nr:hypothetical protein [Acidimicrobiales bacterium]